MRSRAVLLILPQLLVNLLGRCAGYRFLAIFPTPSRSNWVVHEPVIEALARRGHQITVITPYRMHRLADDGHNVTQILLDISSNVSRPLDIEDFQQTWNPYDFVQAVALAKVNLMDHILQRHDVKQLLRTERHWDALIIENLEYYALYALSRVYQVPLIGMTHLDHLDFSNLGSFVHPIFYSGSESILLQNRRKTFMQQVKAFYFEHFGKYFGKGRYLQLHDQLITRYFGKTVPKAEDLVDDLALGIVNGNPAMGSIRPVTPFTIQAGFTHINESHQLPTDLQKFLDNASHGVVYINLGSNIMLNKFDHRMLRTFQVMVEHLNYDVIWRWEDCNLQLRPRNVKIVNWAPQQAVLAHPNVRVFITHGSVLSMQEGVWYGVPMIAIPLFGEHLANARRIDRLNIGWRMSFATLTVESLEEAVQEIATNPVYKTNIVSLSAAIKDVPMSPTETACWWIEHAVRHKAAPHYKPSLIHRNDVIEPHKLISTWWFVAFIVLFNTVLVGLILLAAIYYRRTLTTPKLF